MCDPELEQDIRIGAGEIDDDVPCQADLVSDRDPRVPGHVRRT